MMYVSSFSAYFSSILFVSPLSLNFFLHLLTMIANNSIEVCEAAHSTVGLLEIGKFEGIGVGIGLSIVAGIGLTIKALFIWYIQYRAPKDRPINTLMWHDQVGVLFKKLRFSLLF